MSRGSSQETAHELRGDILRAVNADGAATNYFSASVHFSVVRNAAKDDVSDI